VVVELEVWLVGGVGVASSRRRGQMQRAWLAGGGVYGGAAHAAAACAQRLGLAPDDLTSHHIT